MRYQFTKSIVLSSKNTVNLEITSFFEFPFSRSTATYSGKAPSNINMIIIISISRDPFNYNRIVNIIKYQLEIPWKTCSRSNFWSISSFVFICCCWCLFEISINVELKVELVKIEVIRLESIWGWKGSSVSRGYQNLYLVDLENLKEKMKGDEKISPWKKTFFFEFFSKGKIWYLFSHLFLQRISIFTQILSERNTQRTNCKPEFEIFVKSRTWSNNQSNENDYEIPKLEMKFQGRPKRDLFLNVSKIFVEAKGILRFSYYLFICYFEKSKRGFQKKKKKKKN